MKRKILDQADLACQAAMDRTSKHITIPEIFKKDENKINNPMKDLKELQPDISNIIYRGLAKFVPDHKINLVDDVATDLVEYISERLVKNKYCNDGRKY